MYCYYSGNFLYTVIYFCHGRLKIPAFQGQKKFDKLKYSKDDCE